MNLQCCFIFLLLANCAVAQFAPPAGMPGSTAIAADSPVFVAWATGIELERGYQYIADESLGLADAGEEAAALGAPDDTPMTVSLGDGGVATLSFDKPVRNGEGFDFAVFENSFSDDFLELAFVEVSSDGENFVRFPATSNTQSQEAIGPFGLLDATKINNLAGKYRGLFGTPFDLEELAADAQLDIDHITHIRIIDVVGSLDEAFATYDQNNNAINDPFPTPFPSSGFDLDAIGVIHQNDMNNSEDIDNQRFNLSFYPNPLPQNQPLFIKNHSFWKTNNCQIYLIDLIGNKEKLFYNDDQIDMNHAPAGLYWLQIEINGQSIFQKLMIE